jgi:hypothetical protein
MKFRTIIPRKLSEFTFYFKEGYVFRLGKTEQLTEAEALIKIK